MLYGTLGLLVQLTIALMVWASLYRFRGNAFGALAGTVAATYGYGLFAAALMVWSVSWRVTNVFLTIALCAFGFGYAPVRAALISFARSVKQIFSRHWLAATVIGSLAGFQLFVAALKPEMSIDGQLYHGPILANLVRAGSLWGWNSTNQYLYYTDLTMVSGVNLATFTGQARFDDTIQTLHLVVLMLLIIWVLRQRFESTAVRAGIAALIVSAPVIWMQPRILYVDLAYGTAVALAICLAVLVRRWGRAELLLAAASVSAIVASKPTGILTGALLGVVLLGTISFHRFRAGGNFRTALLHPVGAFAIAAGLSLSFYIRNFVGFGNPVYPVKVDIWRFHLPGIIDLSVFTSGDRGSGFVDIARLKSFAKNVLSGMADGVTKLDYDPRSGGFGQVPLVLVLLVLLLLITQLIWRLSKRDWSGPWLKLWPIQLAMVALATIILLIQPATFDSRYVIGPMVVISLAGLLTTLSPRPLPRAELIAGGLALTSALAMISWTETHVYPGLQTVLSLREASAQWQPTTPGNPWGENQDISWLPSSPDNCLSIAIEWSGGVKEWGNAETAQFSVLPYALSGQSLCNTITPVLKESLIDPDGKLIPGANTIPFNSSQFILLYDQNVEAWKSAIPESASCWSYVQTVSGTETFPQNLDVFRNLCAAG